tara:strand:- start:938 stop:2632 length:1695 start_codon:yes stop_codon:yes gene_type:complete
MDRAQPSGQQRIVSMPVVNSGLGDVAQGLASVGQAVQKKQDADNRGQFDDAMLKMQIAAENENHAYDKDNEYTTIGSRSDESMLKARGEIGSNISDPTMRAEFDMRSELISARTRNHVTKVAWVKERDFGRSEIDALSGDARKAALSGDAAGTLQLFEARLGSAVEQGYLTNQEATDHKTKMRDSVAIGRLNMMEPEDRITALDQPWAKNLDPDVIVKLRRDADAENIKVKAVSTVDALDMTAPRSENLAAIDKIKDPKERAAAEGRYNEEKSQFDQARNETRLEEYNQLDQFVEAGGQYDEISQERLTILTPTMRANLRAIASVTKRTTSDPDAYDRATSLAAKGQWDQLNMHLANFGSNLTETDRRKFAASSAEGMAPSSVTDQQIIDGMLPGDDKKLKEGRVVLLPRINAYRNDYVRTYGKEPTQTEIEKEITRRTKPVVNPDGGYNLWWDGDKPVYQIEDAAMRSEALQNVHMQELKDDNPTAYADTVSYMASQGESGSRHDFEEKFKNQEYINDIRARKAPEIQSVVTDVDEFFSGKTPTQEEWIDMVTRVAEARRGTE